MSLVDFALLAKNHGAAFKTWSKKRLHYGALGWFASEHNDALLAVLGSFGEGFCSVADLFEVD
jgi:hypothetical protein